MNSSHINNIYYIILIFTHDFARSLFEHEFNLSMYVLTKCMFVCAFGVPI